MGIDRLTLYAYKNEIFLGGAQCVCRNWRGYLPLHAMITLLKPTNTPLFGLLKQRNVSIGIARAARSALLPLKQALALIDTIVFALWKWDTANIMKLRTRPRLTFVFEL